MSSGNYIVNLDAGNSSSRTWSGTNWPKLAKGVPRPKPLPDNPYSVTFNYIASIPFLTGGYDGKAKPYLLSPALYAYLSGYAPSLTGAVEPAVDANLELKCFGKITESIRGGGFNAAVATAELPEVVSQVVGMVQKLARAYRAARRGDVRDVIRNLIRSPSSQHRKKGKREYRDPPLHISDASGAHLAATYGWVPLMQDIFEAMELVENYRKERSLIVRKSAGKRQINIGVIGGVGVSRSNPPWQKYSRVQYIVKLKEQPTIWDDLGLSNPASVLWEKIPFSFVWDWVQPVGSYLDALTYVGLFDSTSVKSYLRIAEAQNQWDDHFYPFGSWYTGGRTNMRRGSFVRTVGAVTVPRPNAKKVSQVFSIPHIQNAVALITSAFAKPPSTRYTGTFGRRV